MRSDMWRKGTLEEKSSLACNYLDVRVSDAIHVFRLRQVGQVDAGIGRGRGVLVLGSRRPGDKRQSKRAKTHAYGNSATARRVSGDYGLSSNTNPESLRPPALVVPYKLPAESIVKPASGFAPFVESNV